MRWFPGWKSRMANKTQPRVKDLHIITTTDGKCWEVVLVDLPNCLLHDTFIHSVTAVWQYTEHKHWLKHGLSQVHI